MLHIILLIISLVALGLSIFCIVKREKFNFLYQGNNNIGLQTIDLDQKIDALNQQIDQKIDTLLQELDKKYISYSTPIVIHTKTANECLTADQGPDNAQHFTATHGCGVYEDAQTWFITEPPAN